MRSYALDTNVFINAFNPESPPYGAIQRIITYAKSDEVVLMVSLHSLHELEERRDEAWRLAQTFPVLPHWPVGTWKELVGSWGQQTGSWGEATQNQGIQIELSRLAKSGNDIRDRGAYIDALRAGAYGFVTSDKQLVAPGPAKRINERFATKVLTPERLIFPQKVGTKKRWRKLDTSGTSSRDSFLLFNGLRHNPVRSLV